MGEIGFKEALKHTVEIKGRSIFEKPSVLEAYLLDYAPEDRAIIASLMVMASNHMFNDLADCSASKIQTETEAAIKKIRQTYPEAVADQIENAFFYAFSLKKNAAVKPAPAAPVKHEKEYDNTVSDQTTPPVSVAPVKTDPAVKPVHTVTPGPDPIVQTQITHEIPTYVPPTGNTQRQPKTGLLYMIIGALAVVAVVAVFMLVQGSRNNSKTETIIYVPASEMETATPEAEPAAEQATEQTAEPEKTAEAVSEWPKTGTVYISSNANPRRIIVRTSPKKTSDNSNATSERKYNGDRVTVYEIKQGSTYTWYRIGENRWIAGNGTSFYVKYD